MSDSTRGGTYAKAVAGALALAPVALLPFAGGEGQGARASGLILLAACCAVVMPGLWPLLPRSMRFIAAGLGVFALWTTLSVFWAADAHAPWSDGVLVAGYALWVVLGGVSFVRGGAVLRQHWLVYAHAAPLVVAMIAVGGSLFADSPLWFDHWGRLEGPAQYANGFAALLSVAVCCGLALVASIVSDTREPSVRRAVLAACSTSLAVSMMLLTQSRGAVFALLIACLVLVFASRVRANAVLVVAAVGAPALLLVGSRLDALYRWQPTPSAEFHDELRLVVAAAAVAAALSGGAIALLARSAAGRALGARVQRATLIAAGSVLLVGTIAAVGAHGGIADTTRDVRATFAAAPEHSASETRFGDLSGNGRAIQWRAAYDIWRTEPVAGVGAGNYSGWYFQMRTGDAGQVLSAHSVWMTTLAELGVVGIALLAAIVGAAGAYAVSSLRGAPLSVQLVGVAPCAWLIHTSADWTFRQPSATLAALAALAWVLTLGVAGRSVAHAPIGRSIGASPVVWAGVAVVLIAWSLPLGASTALVTRARDLQGTDQARARSYVSLARVLTPWDASVWRETANRAEAAGDLVAAKKAVRRQIRLDHEHWRSHAFAARFHERIGNDGVAHAYWDETVAMGGFDRSDAR